MNLDNDFVAPRTVSIRSLHDGLPLECRIYHPSYSPRSQHRHSHAAVLAHPYAPLGGSFDDPILLATVEVLLKEGYSIATFNFRLTLDRGAAGSPGTTSWTGKPEVQDFTSIVGFFAIYIATTQKLHLKSEKSECADVASASISASDPIRFIIGGYSYGALQAARLPPLDAIILNYTNSAPGSVAEVNQRQARDLARQQWDAINQAMKRPLRDVAYGASDAIHEPASISLHDGSKVENSRTETASSSVTASAEQSEQSEQCFIESQVAYLLISPVSVNLAALLSVFSARRVMQSFLNDCSPHHPILVVSGSSDTFSPCEATKTAWIALTEQSPSQLEYHTVQGAGHFWREDGALSELQGRVRHWIHGLW